MAKVGRAIITIGFTIVGSILGGPIGAMIGTFIGTALGKLLLPPSKGKRRASEQQMQFGEVPRQAIVGRASTAGSLVDAFNYGGKYGTDWEVLVLDLADHRCDALEGFYVNDAYVPYSGDGMVAGYNNQLQIFWRPGTEWQSVPSILLQYQPGCTPNDNGAGVSYAVVAYKADAADAKNPIWPNGRPKFLFVVRGALCYDSRLDSSVGGSGVHRWDDPATREWTENTIVTRYNFARGFYACDRVGQPEQLLIGRGLSAVEAPPANVFARANVCDELVDGEPRYRVGGIISATETYVDVENDFAAACAGTISQPEGAVEIDPGQAKAAVVTITDRDLVVGSRVKRRWFLGTNDRDWINTVVATFIEPAHKWQPLAAPVRREVADVIADKGARDEQLTLGFVQWVKQAGRVAEIVRRLGRLWIRTEIVLPPRYCDLEEGDWIIWQSDRWLNGLAYTFRIEGWGSDKSWQHSLQLRQISASCYSDTAPLDSGAVAVQQPVPTPLITTPIREPVLPDEGVEIGVLGETDGDHKMYRYGGLQARDENGLLTIGGEELNFAPWVNWQDQALPEASFQISIKPPAPQTIYCDQNGNQLPNQFPPRVLTPEVLMGTEDIRTRIDVSYRLEPDSNGNVVATVNNQFGSADKGRITVTSGQPGFLLLTVIIETREYGPYKITFAREIAPTTTPGGIGARLAEDSTIDIIPSTAFVRIGGPLTVTIVSGEDAICTAPFTYSLAASVSSSAALICKWRVSPAGANTWTDVAASITGTPSYWYQATFEQEVGTGDFNATATGLAPGDYDFELLGAMTNDPASGSIEVFSGIAKVMVE